MKSFWRGFWAPLRALKMILTSPSLLTLVLIPLAINIGLYTLFFYHGAQYIDALIAQGMARMAPALPEWASWLAGVTEWSLKILAWLTLVLAAALTFTIVSGIIASPFNDFLSRQAARIRYRELQSQAGQEIPGGIRETIRLELRRTLILVFGGSAAFLLGLIPLMQLPALAIGALLVSFEYFGYPVSRTSTRLGPVWAFTLKNPMTSLGFGTFLLLLIALPFVSVIYIPLAVVAGTILHTDLSRR